MWTKSQELPDVWENPISIKIESKQIKPVHQEETETMKTDKGNLDGKKHCTFLKKIRFP